MWKKKKATGKYYLHLSCWQPMRMLRLAALFTLRGAMLQVQAVQKSVGQVVFVVFVLLLYDSLSLVRVVIKVQTACRYISHSLPLLGAPFLFKSKKLSCLAFSSPCILWLVVMPSVCRSWKSESLMESWSVRRSESTSPASSGQSRVFSLCFAVVTTGERGKGGKGGRWLLWTWQIKKQSSCPSNYSANNSTSISECKYLWNFQFSTPFQSKVSEHKTKIYCIFIKNIFIISAAHCSIVYLSVILFYCEYLLLLTWF